MLIARVLLALAVVLAAYGWSNGFNQAWDYVNLIAVPATLVILYPWRYD